MGSPNCGGYTPHGLWEEGRRGVRGHIVRRDGCKGVCCDSL